MPHSSWPQLRLPASLHGRLSRGRGPLGPAVGMGVLGTAGAWGGGPPPSGNLVLKLAGTSTKMQISQQL